MRILLILVLSLMIVGRIEAQVGIYGTRIAAFGGAGAALTGDLWAQANPASLASLRTRHLALHATQAFGLAELRLAAAGVSSPIGRACAGISVSTFGTGHFRENDLALAVAVPIFRDARLFDIGMRLAYRRMSIEGFAPAGAPSLAVGWMATALPGVYVGGAIENLLESGFNEIDRLPRTMRLGLGLDATADMILLADVVKEDRFPIAGAVGVEARLVPSIAFRIGAATNPDRLALGAELSMSTITIDLLADRHDELGWTPGLGLAVQW
jgi:hypothetical protein